MKTQHLVAGFLGFVIIAGGAFFVGMKYQESKQPAFSRQSRDLGQSQRNRTGLRPVSGEIISVDDKSITVKLQDNSSKIILFSDKTVINKADQATKNDLKTGQKVAVFGQENSDGSVTAQNIQLNPTFGFGAGANRPSQP